MIAGYFEEDLYSNKNYHVYNFSTNDISASLIPQTKKFAKKQKYLFRVVFRDFVINKKFDKNQEYIIDGVWKENKYGKYFDAFNIERNVKNTRSEILLFLTDIKGVGTQTANKIYEYFKDETINVFKGDINRLFDLSLPRSKVEKIISEYNSALEFKKVYDYFMNFSIPPQKIREIYEKYKESAILTLQVNPFELSSAGCISFIEANSVAVDLEVELDSGERQRQALLYMMKAYFRQKGDLFYLIDDVISLTQKFLNRSVNSKYFVSKEILFFHLNEMNNTEVKIYDKYVYLIKDLYTEKKTAEIIVDFLNYKNNLFKLDKCECMREIHDAEMRFGFTLNPDQQNAVISVMNSNFSIITGGPGTGKSTLLRFILDIFQKNFSGNIKLCSPTGKAARRMAECTGFKSASTVHNLLGIEKDYEWSINSKFTDNVEADLLIIDEASMLDMELAFLLLSSIPFTCKVVFIGDANQLPSVGPGNVLKELINSKIVPTSVLNKIYRQAEQSNIVKNAYNYNNDNVKNIVYDSGKFKTDSFVLKNATQDINNQIADIYINSVKKSSFDDVQILTPFKAERMVASTSQLNRIIQEKINPCVSSDDELICNKKIFRKNDRVIQQKNTEEIKNGDVGTIISVNHIYGDLVSITVDFGDNNIVEYTKEEIEDNRLDLAYALTVHKSQGSEYKTVIMPCIDEHLSMLTKKLVYTAWTRAKEHIIIVGNKEAVNTSVLNKSENIRKTVLAKRLLAEKRRRS